MSTALVAVAGAIGAVTRYQIGLAVGVRAFPLGTLAINVVGCLLLAFLLAGPAAARWPAHITTAVGVGLLGAFTTFSTFGYETVVLVRSDRLGAAAGYVAASVVGGIAATAVGYAAGRALV